MSEAFQAGKIGWAKIRALQSLVTPETEGEWLQFAMNNRTDQVVRKVSLSPKAWKGQCALQASLAGQPMATREQVANLLAQPAETVPGGASDGEPAAGPESEESPGHVTPDVCSEATVPTEPVDRLRGEEQTGAPGLRPTSANPGSSAVPRPKTLRVVFDLTPDQFAVYERAEGRVRASLGKRASRAEVLVRLAEANLDAGSARSRARHQIVIIKNEHSGLAFYDTARGLLPVDAGVLAKLEASDGASRRTKARKLQTTGQKPPDGPIRRLGKKPGQDMPARSPALSSATPGKGTPMSGGRRAGSHAPIGAATLRALFARAGHRCEECGQAGVLLEVHHKVRVSEGGGNAVQDLVVLCGDCHRGEHAEEFASRTDWQRARAWKQSLHPDKSGYSGRPAADGRSASQTNSRPTVQGNPAQAPLTCHGPGFAEPRLSNLKSVEQRQAEHREDVLNRPASQATARGP